MKKFFNYFIKNKFLAIILILINLGGTGFGFYYYQQQLVKTPNYLWLFVPDSPLYCLLFVISMVLILMNKKSNLLFAIASIGLIKVGLWTCFVIPLYSKFFLSPSFFNYYLILWILHFGMIVEAFVLIYQINFKKLNVFIPLIWFLLNDFFDYFVGTVPYPLPMLTTDYTIMLTESFLVTILLSGIFYYKKIK